RARQRSKHEGARTSDRCTLLPRRNPGGSFPKPAVRRRAHYGVQPIGEADFSRWRSEYGCSGLRIHRQDKEESTVASLPIRHACAAYFGERPCEVSSGRKTKMMAAWYQRMNPSEQLLSWFAAGTGLRLPERWILGW